MLNLREFHTREERAKAGAELKQALSLMPVTEWL
jgi:hypothetical protein